MTVVEKINALSGSVTEKAQGMKNALEYAVSALSAADAALTLEDCADEAAPEGEIDWNGGRLTTSTDPSFDGGAA